MEKKELYNSAINKLQKMYELLFDENGNLRPEINLTDDEIKAFRNSAGDINNQGKVLFETLFGGIIYNKYTFKYEKLIKKIFELSEQIFLLNRKKNSSYNQNQIYTCQAHDWNGSFLFSGNGNPEFSYECMESVKIGLYNLNGTYSYEIDLSKDNETSKVVGKLTIIRDRVRKSISWNVPSTYQDYGVEEHNLNEIASKEVADVIVITENELSQILNSLIIEVNRQPETNGFRTR